MNQTPTEPENPMVGMTYWAKLWQQQFELSLKFWALWAQALPRETSRDVAAEVEARKTPPALDRKVA